MHLREYNQDTDEDYVYITGESSGCWSYVGRTGGVSYLIVWLVNVIKLTELLRSFMTTNTLNQCVIIL